MEHLRNRLRNLLELLLEALDARQEGVDYESEEMQDIVAAAGYRDEDMQELLVWLQNRWAPGVVEPGVVDPGVVDPGVVDPRFGGSAWLSSRLVSRAGVQTLRQPGQREDELLTPGAFGYLLDLVRTGQISAEQMESLIQFAQIAPEGPLSVGELSSLMDRVVFGEPAGRGPTVLGRSDRVH